MRELRKLCSSLVRRVITLLAIVLSFTHIALVHAGEPVDATALNDVADDAVIEER
jgi:hypothetical protein